MNNNHNGLTKFTESGFIDHKLIHSASEGELKESLSRASKRIRESVKASPDKGYFVPISFYNKINANNRNYTKELWENVINNQRESWVGAPMLCDHPADDSDGSPKDICGVWLDAKLGPAAKDGSGLVYGLLIPSGSIGKDLEDHLSKGLKVGTSSSGYGSVLKDGVTVDPETYIIERLSDWVLNPSQGTFFSYDDNEVEDSSIKESIENRKMNVIKENAVKDSKISKLEEKKFRRDMESFLEDANNIKDPQERLEEFKEIKSYLEEGACPDLREKIEQKIQEQEEYIKNALLEKEQFKESFGINNPAELGEKLSRVAEEAQTLKRESNDWKKIAETLQEKVQETRKELQSRPTSSYAAYQRETINNLTESYNKTKAEAQSLVKELKEAYETLKDEHSKLEEKFKDLEASNEKLEESANKAEEEIASLKSQLEESQKKVNSNEIALKESTIRNKAMADILSRKSLDLEASENTIKKLRTLSIVKENKISRLTRKAESLEDTLASMNEEEEQAKLESKKTDIDFYIEELEDIYGNDIEEFEEELLECRSLAEAKRKFYTDILQRLPNSEEITKARLPESVAISTRDRVKAIGAENFIKTSFLDNKPKGWL